MVYAVQNRIQALCPAFAIMAGFLAAFPPTSIAENSMGLSYQTHWLANTSGQPGSHIQNFIEDMSVIYVSDKQFPGPMVVTKSFWDEGGRPNAVYQDGRRIGFNMWKDRTDSRTAVYQGDTCRILNFYGRSFLFKLAPPPSTPDSSPRVSCTDGSTIASVEDPTAVAFDRVGRLLIGDNGPDQNVKIFTRAPGGWLRSGAFGETGGVFAGPVRGAAGPRRFWGIRGLGVDSVGNLYVGCTGIPMQTMGGTDIRVFSAKDSSLLWNVQGLSFVNSADADPASEAGSVFLNAKRFRMDWKSPPGKSWSLAGVTLDPFRYPDDPRLQFPMEIAWVRRIEGQLFLFLSSMHSSFVAVFRFSPPHETAIPCAFICARWNGGGEGENHKPWMDSIRPRIDSSWRVGDRWMWRDNNGDGRVSADEFRRFALGYPYVKGIDVDDSGSIRFGGRKITLIRSGGLESGIPRFSSISFEKVPFSEGSSDALRLRYLARNDVMYLAGGERWTLPSFVYRYTNWSKGDSARTVHRISIPYQDLGPEIPPSLDNNTDSMVLPMGFAADTEHIFVTYLDIGPDGKCRNSSGALGACRGEVTVLDAKTGRRIGWMAPDSTVGWYSGAIDLAHPINITVRPNGEKIVFVEEDGRGKIMAYRWCPSGDSSDCRGTRKTPGPPSEGPIWKRRSDGGILIRGDIAAKARRIGIVDPRGKTIHSAIPEGINQDLLPDWWPINAPRNLRGLVVIKIESDVSTRSFRAVLLR